MKDALKYLSARPDGLLLTLAIATLILAKAMLTSWAGLELHYDEAQYWEWSQQLDWSYYSKGPLVAWLIALSTAWFGHGEWQVRLPAWLFHGGFLALVFYFARDVWNSRAAAWWALILVLTTPLYFTLGLVMTTDNLLLVFWTWGLWATHRALAHQHASAWYSTGAAVGLGALTKLSIGLLPAFVGIAVIAKRTWRAQLLKPQLWSGMLLMLVCMSPLLYWNAMHDWVMFRHELGHVESTGDEAILPLDFIASQILALSPIVVAIAFLTLRRRPEATAMRFLWWLSIAWFGFFLFKSMGAKVQVNWAAPCYIGMIVLLAGHVEAMSRARRKWLHLGLATSIVLSLIMLFPQIIGLTEKEFAPLKKLKGWSAPITEIATHAGPVDFILSEDYIIAAELAFYWPTRLPVYVTGSAGRRMNQHDLWPGIDREQGRTAIVVQKNVADFSPLITRAFASCTALPSAAARDRNGEVFRTFYAWRCEQYAHLAWPTPEAY